MKKLMYPNIEAERARKGLTQVEIATALGVTRKTYYSWVVEGNIPQPQVSRLAEYFGVSSDYLLGRPMPGYCPM